MSILATRAGVAGALTIVCCAAQAAAPAITSFTPTRAHLGDRIVITGSGFTGAHHVTIGGTAAKFKLVSPTQITATVPATASGPIDVKTPDGTGSSGSKAVTILPSLVLSSATVEPGAVINITGAGFDAYATIDVYIDTADLALTATNKSGVFSGVLTVPASTQPGMHWMSLDERKNHYGVQALLTVDTDWVQPGFNASGQGSNLLENTLTYSTVTQLLPAWIATSSEYGNVQPLSVVNGVTFVRSEEGTIRALGPNGALVWTAPFADTGIDEQLGEVVAGNLVIFADSTTLAAFKVNCGTAGATCTPVWTQTMPVAVTAPLTLYNGNVYVPGADGQIRPVNPATGAVGTAFYAYENTQGPITTKVTFGLDGGVTYGNGQLFQFRFADESYITTTGGYVSAGAVLGNVAYFTSTDGMLRSTGDFNPVTVGITNCGYTPAPVIANGNVYAGSCNSVGAYSPATGAANWTTGGFSYLQGITAAGELLYVCADYHLNIYEAAYGGLLWSGGACNTTPVVVNGSVYTSVGSIYAYTINGGTPLAIPARPSLMALKPNFALVAQRAAN